MSSADRLRQTRQDEIARLIAEGHSRTEAKRLVDSFVWTCPECGLVVSRKPEKLYLRKRRDDGGWQHAEHLTAAERAAQAGKSLQERLRERREHRDAARLAVTRDGRLA